jgi:hypothetical protein
MSCVTDSSELHSALPSKCSPLHGEELNIVLMCVMPVMVPILRSTEHIRNFVEVQCLKMYRFLQHVILYS